MPVKSNLLVLTSLISALLPVPSTALDGKARMCFYPELHGQQSSVPSAATGQDRKTNAAA
ncbi:hypothetical protein CLAFUW4_09127 [Fulvia fulva]|uniref:Uncharacterized protein n=1 Tax=Passalora fulva TaxID=5499 RepID=A0A9Q8PGH7_PASFU|nr:uncharacterized protein CLAFUR5_09238 [Fulvia fulva]KAK4614030.1 hypothetical protein CLAFUR4_09133 [Fulvia fulva]KAK4614630.1 hypothetical protein CLAFUR0_09125 [Fulvia fulva]UJO22184.1 hypothetical protein CLAFUR5_09238 [Fulvia fulva]WPV19939.1 hypothetical protein CLAFUW4_09127 [Fulvia fulva]WPV35161.1 hypothetical protein CLAFUW7_09128 [Fulvia fulva]